MIEEFEVIEKKTNSIGTVYDFKFKLNDNIYYSHYTAAVESQIYIFRYYHKDFDYHTKSIPFSKESKEEIKSFILKQKEIRLRHLMKPYIFQ